MLPHEDIIEFQNLVDVEIIGLVDIERPFFLLDW